VSRDSRLRMVRSAAMLIRTHGVNATSFSEVLASSGAPRGSIYHHFPEGKEQLAEDAIKWTREWVLGYQRRCPARTSGEVLDWFVDLWRQVVVASEGTEGCAIAGVAVDTMPDSRHLMAAVRSAFDSCIELLTEQLRSTGIPANRARALGVTALAGMEGAMILCRAERGVRPLEAVASELARLLPSGTRRGRSRTTNRRPSRGGAQSALRRNR
jgi:TetR/AcrR family transcriptional repressor of lmrAB and yxaGH operons